MAITNGYCTLAQLKAALRVTDSLDNDMLEVAIESASREIDGACERVFYSTSGTRVYAPTNVYYMNTDDIVSVTTLKSSSDGVTYNTTWTTSDYQLEPLNGVAGGLVGHPYTRIRAVGDYLLPAWATGTIYNLEASMQVVGVFGWSSIPTPIKQATIILAMRLFKRLDSPLGIAGFGDMGQMRVGRFDPDVEALLAPFRKVSAG
jgi:hypothetical protein